LALGINTESVAGDILPICKYDARAGRFFRIDRINDQGNWVKEEHEITDKFTAIMDLENIEVGWMNFETGGAPDFQLVALGQDAGQRPSDKHREGFRVMLKLAKHVGGEEPIREFSACAKAVIGGFDALHDAYVAGAKANPGKLPVVKLAKTQPITTGSGAKKSTNYAPVFEITSWVSRPQDLVFKPRAKASNGHDTPKTATPPTTGSTRAAPPPAATPAQQPEMAEDDFG
jgi:hypothetical protein